MDEAFGSVDEILDFAIARDAEASEFYADLAGAMDVSAMRQVFEDFAREEQGHKAKLEAVTRGEYSFGSGAAKADNDARTHLFLSLAGEEAKHKLRFEVAYDDNVFKED